MEVKRAEESCHPSSQMMAIFTQNVHCCFIAWPLSAGIIQPLSLIFAGVQNLIHVDAHLSLILRTSFKWDWILHGQLPCVSYAHSPWGHLFPCCSCGILLSGYYPHNGKVDWPGSGSGKCQDGIHGQEVKLTAVGAHGVQEQSCWKKENNKKMLVSQGGC